MKTIRIKERVHEKGCTIFIGNGLLEKIGKIQNLHEFSRIFIVTDKNVEQILLKRLTSQLSVKTSCIVLDPGEKAKNIDSVKKIWQAMHRARCDRKTLVINVGGGVIGDMGGFAAATYMRGLSYLTIPTTLLAQADASIGGKTGIDFDGIKNLIGTFTQPIAVVIDPNVLRTLPDREFISGFAEIIKHGLIADKKHFIEASSKKPRDFSPKELEHIISESVAIKAQIVAKDPTEKDLRKILNFGHTIGHAVEALSLKTNKPLLHGEAISIGMVAEAKISLSLNMLSASEFEQIHKTLLHAGLPVEYSIKTSKILEKIKSDKKNVRDIVNFTLLDGIGKAKINQHVSQEILIKALEGVTRI